jgi:hypothetical protein
MDLPIDIFFPIFFEKFYAVLIDDWFYIYAASGAEFDIFSVTQYKTFVSNVFVDGMVKHVGKLIYFQLFWNESGILDVDYILYKDFLASSRELDYLDEYFGDIIR